MTAASHGISAAPALSRQNLDIAFSAAEAATWMQGRAHPIAAPGVLGVLDALAHASRGAMLEIGARGTAGVLARAGRRVICVDPGDAPDRDPWTSPGSLPGGRADREGAGIELVETPWAEPSAFVEVIQRLGPDRLGLIVHNSEMGPAMGLFSLAELILPGCLVAIVAPAQRVADRASLTRGLELDALVASGVAGSLANCPDGTWVGWIKSSPAMAYPVVPVAVVEGGRQARIPQVTANWPLLAGKQPLNDYTVLHYPRLGTFLRATEGGDALEAFDGGHVLRLAPGGADGQT